MRRFVQLLTAFFLVCGTVSGAEGPEIQYVKIYNLIQQADKLSQGGDNPAAVEKYKQAQSDLRALRESNPGWNERLVLFRLAYVAGKLDQLPKETPVAPVAATAASTNQVQPPDIMAPTSDTENRIRILTSEVGRLAAAKAVLEAKLEEALAAPRGTVPPEQLAEAQKAIQSMRRENVALANEVGQLAADKAMLEAQLNDAVSARAKMVDASELAEARQGIQSLQKQNQILTNEVGRLTADKAVLETKLNESISAQASMVDPAQLADAQQETQSLQKQNQILTVEVGRLTADKAALETRLNDALSVQSNMVDTSELVSARQTIQSLQKQSQILTNEVGRLTANKAAIEMKLNDAVSAQAKMVDMQQLAMAQQTILSIQDENELLTKRIALLTSDKADLESKLSQPVPAPVTPIEPAPQVQVAPTVQQPPERARPMTNEIPQPSPDKTRLVAEIYDARQTRSDLAESAPDKQSDDKAKLIKQQINLLEGQIQLLRSDRSVLESRIREAVSVKPAAATPQQLATAQQTISTLQQENNLLRNSLAQGQAKMSDLMEPQALESMRTELESDRKELAQQAQRIAALTEEKKLLESNAPRVNETLKISQIRSENMQLRERIISMENGAHLLSSPSEATLRFDASVLGGGDESARVKQLEEECDELRTRLAMTTEALAASKTNQAAAKPAELSGQLENIQNQLKAIEKQCRPFKVEELRLFRLPKPTVNTASLFSTGASEWIQVSIANLPSSASALINEAKQDFGASRYAEAEAKFSKARVLAPDNAFVLCYLAASQLNRNNLGSAETTLKQAMALAPDEPRLLSLAGILRCCQARHNEAIDDLSRAAKANPRDAEMQSYLGIALSHLGYREAAESALRKAVSLAPGYANAHYNLAIIYAAQSPAFPDIARYHYTKAIEGGMPATEALEKLLAKTGASAP